MTAKIPDHLPSGPEWEAQTDDKFVDALAKEIDKVIRRYSNAVSRGEIIGVLEALKFERLKGWFEAMDDDDEA